MFLHHLWSDRSNDIYRQPLLQQFTNLLHRRAGRISLLRDHESSSSSLASKRSGSGSGGAEDTEVLLGDDITRSQELSPSDDEGLTLKETAKLALEFCILWFLANYFAAACLEYTTVASSTILASTSSI